MTIKKARRDIAIREEEHVENDTAEKIINVMSNKHARNDGLSAAPKRDFDTANTQESHQLKINYFDNRYGPDEELE